MPLLDLRKTQFVKPKVKINVNELLYRSQLIKFSLTPNQRTPSFSSFFARLEKGKQKSLKPFTKS